MFFRHCHYLRRRFWIPQRINTHIDLLIFAKLLHMQSDHLQVASFIITYQYIHIVSPVSSFIPLFSKCPGYAALLPDMRKASPRSLP